MAELYDSRCLHQSNRLSITASAVQVTRLLVSGRDSLQQALAKVSKSLPVVLVLPESALSCECLLITQCIAWSAVHGEEGSHPTRGESAPQ